MESWIGIGEMNAGYDLEKSLKNLLSYIPSKSRNGAGL